MTGEGEDLVKAATSAGEHVVRLAAGVADLALDRLSGALHGLYRVMCRSDLEDIVVDGHDDLVARGELVLGRFGATSVPHMELVARRVAERHGDA